MAVSERHGEHPCVRQRIEALTRGDVAAGLALSDAAGWNQTADDWAFFVDAKRALGIRDEDGRLVATAASLGDGRCAWISLVLVDAACRHRGLAGALVARCLEAIDEGNETAVLDATPAGAEVYGRLGFAPTFAYARWRWTPGQQTTAAQAERGDRTRSVSRAPLHGAHHAESLERIVALDWATHGRDRRGLFASILARAGTRAWLADDGGGFVVARAGRRAWQIGPLVAADDARAASLLGAALDALDDQRGSAIVIDVPADRLAVGEGLKQRGFVVERPFVRMARADTAASRLAADSHVLAGPEYG